MTSAAPFGMLQRAKEKNRKTDRMERVLAPIFIILAVLGVATLWGFPILDMLGRLQP